jgi:hypothetical protein
MVVFLNACLPQARRYGFIRRSLSAVYVAGLSAVVYPPVAGQIDFQKITAGLSTSAHKNLQFFPAKLAVTIVFVNSYKSASICVICEDMKRGHP